jgi:hypothetical protein
VSAASACLGRSTIHDDGKADVLNGGDGADWFLARAVQDSVKKNRKGDVVTDITGW